jgi:hypothetical protein
MVDRGLVSPVTTASGNETVAGGVGVGAIVGDGDEAAVGSWVATVEGLGAGLVHAHSSAATAMALTSRIGIRVITTLS